MKLKEVCERTGLTRKTIRLYEEKGLLVPQKEYRNGREYREYTDEDIRQLQIIALLRRAWFTMDEIKRMMEDPENIQEIFPQYRQWLRQQKQQLEVLLSVAETVEIASVESVSALTDQMAAAAEKLPLPAYDIRPRFKHLDKLEEGGRAMRKESKKADNWEKPLEGGISDTRAYRQLVASTSKGRADDLGVAFGQLRDAEQMFKEAGTGPVQREKPELPRKIRIPRAIALVLMLLFGYGSIMFSGIGAEGAPVIAIQCIFLLSAVTFFALVIAGIRWKIKQ